MECGDVDVGFPQQVTDFSDVPRFVNIANQDHAGGDGGLQRDIIHRHKARLIAVKHAAHDAAGLAVGCHFQMNAVGVIAAVVQQGF